MPGLPTVPERGPAEQCAPETSRPGFVLGLDVGSSVIRCHVYDRAGRIRGSSAQKVENLYPQIGWVEIDPDILWLQFVSVIKESVKAAGIEMNQIIGLGISTQRATFITWNKKTGKHFHNFITWQDLRAIELVKSWNTSLIMKLIHSSCRMLHFFTRSKRFLAASLFTFTTQHVSLRLAWILQNLVEVQKAIEEENCCFGTVDTWLLHKLTKGSEFATDFSNASTTGLFDPYEMCWSGLVTSLLSIPLSLLPPVRDTSYNFGSVDEEIFGTPIPIMALVADQQSAMFGECCFQRGDVKLTMGTGTFLDINTGNNPQQSVGGFYPLIGWKIGQEVVCLAEGNAGDTGTAIKWAQQLGIVFFISRMDSQSMLFIVCIDHIFCIQSSIEGHFGCFHVLATVNKAAMNIGAHTPLRITVFKYYSAIRKDKIVRFATTWMNLEIIMLSEISQTKKVENHMILLICEI